MYVCTVFLRYHSLRDADEMIYVCMYVIWLWYLSMAYRLLRNFVASKNELVRLLMSGIVKMIHSPVNLFYD